MTDSLKTFLDQERDAFDLASILSRDIEEMEAGFPGDAVYKYYSETRRSFLTKPQVRFTQKAGLNDPFELTKRWQDFGTAPTRDLFISYLQSSLRGYLSRKDLIAERIRANFEEQGQSLTSEQMVAVVSALNGPAGEAFLAQQMSLIDAMIEPMIGFIFSELAANSDKMIDDVISDIGILSVSETATNHQLWALYADSGKGFAVELKVQHQFFRTIRADGTDVNLLRRVTYTDARIPDFWQNPYYLFLVKGQNWSFEREWRMIKKLSECTRLPLSDAGGIYVRDVPPGAIKSVIFGYNYDRESLVHDAQQIVASDPDVDLQRIAVNGQSGELEVRPLPF
jgi:hypothetical protein